MQCKWPMGTCLHLLLLKWLQTRSSKLRWLKSRKSSLPNATFVKWQSSALGQSLSSAAASILKRCHSRTMKICPARRTNMKAEKSDNSKTKRIRRMVEARATSQMRQNSLKLCHATSMCTHRASWNAPSGRRASQGKMSEASVAPTRPSTNLLCLWKTALCSNFSELTEKFTWSTTRPTKLPKSTWRSALTAVILRSAYTNCFLNRSLNQILIPRF